MQRQVLVITRISYLLDTELVLPPLWGGQRLARGERFLRTPGSNIRAKTHPEGVAGHPGPFTRSVLQPLPGRICKEHVLFQGFAKSAHPWLISFRSSGA